MTLVPNDLLMLSNSTVDEVTHPISDAAVGGNTPSNSNSTSSPDGNKQGLVGKLISRYVASLKKERLLFSIFLILWLIVALIALLIIAWHSYGVEWVKERKKRKFQREKEGHITPWYHRAASPAGVVTMTNETPSLRGPTGLFPADASASNERTFRGTLEDEVEIRMSEIDLRSFTPLATPKPRNSGFVMANGWKKDSLAPPTVMNEKEASGSVWEEEEERKKSRWSIWKSMGTKLRNENRRADRMMDPSGYHPRRCYLFTVLTNRAILTPAFFRTADSF